MPPLAGRPSQQLSLISIHLANAVEWKTRNALNSDHLPSTISFVEDSHPIQTKCTYTNIHRADWTSFTVFTEQQFNSIPPRPHLTSAAQAVNKFKKITLNAARTIIIFTQLN